MVLDYRLNAGALEPVASIFESRPNTPAAFPVYMLGLVLDHIRTEEGGLSAVSERLNKRVHAIYAAADRFPQFYQNDVHPSARSRMNAVFMLPTRELEKEFVAKAEAKGLLHLYGHPVSGGIRVTMYNWVRDESVYLVAEFMRAFAEEHGQSAVEPANKTEL